MKKLGIISLVLLAVSSISAMEQDIAREEAKQLELAIALSLSTLELENKPSERLCAQEQNDALLAQTLQEEEYGSPASAPSARGFGHNDNEAASRALAQKLHQEEVGKTVTRHKTPQQNITSTVLPANKQSGATCGYHAAINAKAIQDLVNARKPITAHTIQEQAKKYLSRIHDTKSIESENVIAFARMIGLNEHDLYFLHIDGGTVKPAYQTIEAQQAIITQLQNIKYQDTALAHCICHIGQAMSGHWFVVSVIKESGKSPHIVCLDSTNGQGGPGSPAHKFMQYIKSILS